MSRTTATATQSHATGDNASPRPAAPRPTRGTVQAVNKPRPSANEKAFQEASQSLPNDGATPILDYEQADNDGDESAPSGNTLSGSSGSFGYGLTALQTLEGKLEEIFAAGFAVDALRDMLYQDFLLTEGVIGHSASLRVVLDSVKRDGLNHALRFVVRDMINQMDWAHEFACRSVRTLEERGHD